MMRLAARASVVRVVCTVTLATTCAVLIGCSRPSATVTGKVTYQGKTVKGGNVSFFSTDGGQEYGSPITEDGTYTIHKITAGDYKVCVETESLKPRAGMGGTFGGGGPPGGKAPQIKGGEPPPGAEVPDGKGAYQGSNPSSMAAAKAAKNYIQIPSQYSKQESTTLTTTLNGGENTYNIELK